MIKILVGLALLGFAAAHGDHAHEHHDHGPSVNSMSQAKVKQYCDTLKKDYMSSLRPYGVNGTDATYVYFALQHINVIHVDEDKGLFTFQAFAKKAWFDTRLAYNDTSIPYIPIPKTSYKDLWMPDVLCIESVPYSDFKMDYDMTPKFMKITPQGKVKFGARITKTIRCPSILHKDKKEFTCPIHFMSLAYPDDQLMLMPKEDGVSFEASDLPKYKVADVSTAPNCDAYKAKLKKDDAGQHRSCVELNFKFTRT